MTGAKGTGRGAALAAIAVLAAILPVSCFETSGNGKLGGMWHLESVDTLETGGVRDMSGEYIYWSFQYDLLELDDKTGANPSILFRFEYNEEGYVLELYSPYVYDREDGDIPTEDISLLLPFCVRAPEITYAIESLSGSRMILREAELRLHFRKL